MNDDRTERTPKGKVRRTIYLLPETDDIINRLQRSYREETDYFPTISKTAWIHLLLEAGINTVADSLEEMKWMMDVHGVDTSSLDEA